MAVSGLPQTNDGRHTAKISSISVELLDQVSCFKA